MMNHWETMMACKLALNSHFFGLLTIIFFVISYDNFIDSLNLRLHSVKVVFSASLLNRSILFVQKKKKSY
jgi:hypothetical protein